MPNSDLSIRWFDDHKPTARYSMAQRRGPDYDCSSAQYYSLIQGNYFPVGIYIGNTDSLYNDLEKYGWVQLKPDAQGNYDTQRNDVFIWGTRGKSGGADGHTGRFVNANDVTHCSAYYNGIHTNNYDDLHRANGWINATYYRYVGGASVPNIAEPVDQVVNPGSVIRFNSIFRVDDVQKIADIWQVRTDALCPVGFTWADNGIPAAPLVEVDSDGYATPDQALATGSRYILPGKFIVLDVGQSAGRWLAQIAYGEFKFWVDLETATEVGESDPGTPTPPQRPQVTTTTTTVLLEKPNGTVPQNTDSAPTGVTTTSTTVAPEPITTTTTTILDDETLACLDLETDGAPTPRPPIITGDFSLGFWAAFWSEFKKAVKTVLDRLRGVK